MRKVTSLLCAMAFMISGVMMAIAESKPINTGYKTIAASTMPNMHIPTIPIVANDTGTFDLPEDLLRTLAKRKKVLDTVYITKTDTIREQVTKVKWRKASAPPPVVVRDTIIEPHYYLATQVGNKEGPTGEHISVYEVHKVDNIYPEVTISSTDDD